MVTGMVVVGVPVVIVVGIVVGVEVSVEDFAVIIDNVEDIC
jgi:hypothetical protein